MKHETKANSAPAKDHGQFWGLLSWHDDVAGLDRSGNRTQSWIEVGGIRGNSGGCYGKSMVLLNNINAAVC